LEVGFSKPKDNTLEIHPPHDDQHAWQHTLLDAFGTANKTFDTTEIIRLMQGLRNKGELHASGDELNAALAAVDDARPASGTAPTVMGSTLAKRLPSARRFRPSFEAFGRMRAGC